MANAHLCLVAAISVLMTVGVNSGHAQAQNPAPAPEEYRNSCQTCHGPDGKGNGPLARFLTVKPSDLTTLSKRNAGTFPLLKVMQTIDGRIDVAAHGGRAMPVWGKRYSEEIGEKYGPYGGEAVVRARLLELVYYIQSIQQN